MSLYLRTEDLSQYARIMASVSDTPGVVSKLTQMADRLDEQNDHIERLEEAGDAMAYEGWNEPYLSLAWRKAKEAKP